MPDSNITKKALAMAMKELMEQIPFSKISVSDICEKCGMNRKSFYYHFKDKYDLVNWIFDVEFFQAVHVRDYNLPNWSWRFLEDSCQYFYENQSFYRKALQIEGQNSFVDFNGSVIGFDGVPDVHGSSFLCEVTSNIRTIRRRRHHALV